MIDIDYRQIADTIPDTLRRTPIRKDWLYLDISAVDSKFNEFQTEFDYYKFLASHNYQVMSIEHLLNNILQPSGSIYLTDGLWYDETYLYFNGDATATETYLFNTGESGSLDTYLRFNSEYELDQFDFTVNVPAYHSGSVDFNNKMNGLIKLYLLAGRTYIINYY